MNAVYKKARPCYHAENPFRHVCVSRVQMAHVLSVEWERLVHRLEKYFSASPLGAGFGLRSLSYKRKVYTVPV